MAEQTYKTYTFKPGPVLVCMGCGAVVVEMKLHDRFHSKTRSIV